MKRIFSIALLFVALIFMPNNTQAQTKFGLKAGFELTDLKIEGNITSPKNKVGFFVGPTVKFAIPITGLGVEASLLYHENNLKWDLETTNQQAEQSSSVLQRQLLLPINLRYSVGLGSLASIFAFAGPQFGFNLNKGTQSLFNGDIDWNFKRAYLSVNVGLGATLLSKFQVSAGYNIACGSMGHFSASDAIKGITQKKASSWQVGVAYYF